MADLDDQILALSSKPKGKKRVRQVLNLDLYRKSYDFDSDESGSEEEMAISGSDYEDDPEWAEVKSWNPKDLMGDEDDVRTYLKY